MPLEASKVQKKIRVSRQAAIEFQLLTELIFLRRNNVIQADIDLLTLLGAHGPLTLSAFCELVASQQHVAAQTVRNRVNLLEKRGFLQKGKDSWKKFVQLHPDLGIVVEGNVLVEFSLLGVQ